jgi:2-octaprenyl-6-methoxyphenol hydroxylase
MAYSKTGSSLNISDADKAEIIVVGGGLAGLVTAFALGKNGNKVIHLAPEAPVDRRTSALMSPSVDILVELGLVGDPGELGVPLEKIRIIDATKRLIRAPEALFDSAEARVAAFGFNFANAAMTARFSKFTKRLSNLETVAATAVEMTKVAGGWQLKLSNGRTIEAPLLVGADGKRSFVRDAADISIKEKRHSQSAVVCDLTLEFPLNGESVEFHYENGPFTLVPAGGLKANLVWIDRAETLEQVKSGNKASILAALQQKSQNLFGSLKLDSGAFVFPLSSFQAHSLGRNGIVLLGEAAHAFPPIGAQGLNLSLRDIEGLLGAINATGTEDDNWAAMVSTNYAGARKRDVQRTNIMVGTLFSSLLSEFLPAQFLRAGGVWALKSMPQLRKIAFDLGMGADR